MRSATPSSLDPEGLEQGAELLGGQPRIAHDAAKRERIHQFVTRNGKDASTIGHDDVTALAHDLEARFLESFDGIKMVDPRNLWQG